MLNEVIWRVIFNDCRGLKVYIEFVLDAILFERLHVDNKLL